ncbi:peptidylprolyl isomerase [Brachyspira hampsonii]|uniref:Peptidyl-prolyl cis-trans isomerase n=2 Tax=Brachyspira hampsonii TaxID=1287055 RepID=A0A2U4FI36_9SPIR|nr:peptidylprolyl isomerase [Brachyspira hampsonii]EKV56871.1 peptidyl-prolyl cis-trans isomerase B [Brachyspira hampsonii 30446]MBW5390073.1 peptidylprolyl isomerase [Brachyspira hampsonii]PTY39868.1 peptidylprolyl isomerase [Brachyspira hampsonii bv. II]
MGKKLKIITISLLGLIIFGTVLIAQKPKTSKEHLFIETNFGTIEIAFFPEKAPKHVEAIKKLANEGFYDGTLFHRVIPGFMIQGGDPLSKQPNRALHGTGGPNFVIPAEFNDISHKRGICSMARGTSINSAGSQFFICVADSPFLDGQYTVWGEVVSGMDVADKIVALKRDANDNPLEPAKMNRVYVKTVN